MSQPINHLYEFGRFRLDAAERLLLRDGEAVQLTPKAFDLLLVLVQNHGHLLEKDELLKRVWPDSFVEEANLSYNVSLIRKALGEGENGQRYIETVPKRGYRFVAGVQKVAEGDEESGGAEQVRPPAFNEERPPAANGRETEGVWAAGTAHWVSRVKRRQRAAIATLAILIAAGAGVFYLAPSLRRTFQAEQPPPQRKLWQLTFDAGLQNEPTWSPDGRFIAYSADRGGNFDIWVQPAGEGNPVQVTTSPAHDWQPDWSPSGTRIVFRSERDGGGLFVVPTTGGAERKVSGFGYRPRWSPDGAQILFYSAFLQSVSNLPKMYLVALDGSQPREVLAEFLPAFTHQSNELRVAWHPDGRRVSFWVRRRDLGWEFWTAPLAGSAPVKSELAPAVEARLKEAAVEFNELRWAPSGQALYFEGTSRGVRNLWKVEVEPRTLRWVAGPERLTTGPGLDTAIAPSPDGKRLAYAVRTGRTRLWSLPFNAAAGRTGGAGQPITKAGIDIFNFDLSRDGKKLLFIVNRGGKEELWEKSLDDGQEKLLIAADEATSLAAIWSRDGRRAACSRQHYTNPERTRWERSIVLLPAGGGDGELLTSPDTPAVAYDWAADGEWVPGRFPSQSSKANINRPLPVRGAPHAVLKRASSFPIQNITSIRGASLPTSAGFASMPSRLPMPTPPQSMSSPHPAAPGRASPKAITGMIRAAGLPTAGRFISFLTGPGFTTFGASGSTRPRDGLWESLSV